MVHLVSLALCCYRFMCWTVTLDAVLLLPLGLNRLKMRRSVGIADLKNGSIILLRPFWDQILLHRHSSIRALDIDASVFSLGLLYDHLLIIRRAFGNIHEIFVMVVVLVVPVDPPGACFADLVSRLVAGVRHFNDSREVIVVVFNPV